MFVVAYPKLKEVFGERLEGDGGWLKSYLEQF